eukprot:131888_1
MASASSLSVCVISSVIISILFIIIIFKSIKHLLCKSSVQSDEKSVFKTDDRNKIKKYKLYFSLHSFIRYGTISSVIIYFVANILSTIDIFSIFVTGNIFIDPIFVTAFWFMGRTLMNSVFVFRLTSSFNDTMYKLNKCVSILLYCLLLSLPLCVLYLLCIKAVGQYRTANIQRITWLIVVSLILVFDCMLSTSLLILFPCKLVQLIKAYIHFIDKSKNSVQEKTYEVEFKTLSEDIFAIQDRTHSIASIPSDINPSKCKQKYQHVSLEEDEMKTISEAQIGSENIERIIETKKHRKDTRTTKKLQKVTKNVKMELINTVTQYSILIFVSIITSWLVAIIGIATFSDLLFRLLISIDSYINSLCLFLQFPFAIKLYKNLCPNKLCVVWIGKCVDKKIGIRQK